MRRLTSRIFAFTTAMVALAGAGQAGAQDYTFGWNPRTGDVWMDTWLDDVNRYGGRYREPFIDEMVRYYGAPRDLVAGLLVDQHWAPGDVYYACAIAQIIGRPCRYVVDQWEREHGQGWGQLAQRLGIRPGSDEFHRLKRGFVPTYDRWARPIRIDEDLYRYYPERAKAERARAESRGNASAPAGRNGRAANDHPVSARGQEANGRGQGGKSTKANSGTGNNGNGKGNGNGNGGHEGNADNRGNRGGEAAAAARPGTRGASGEGHGSGRD